MSDTMQSLEQLSQLKPAAPEAPKYVKKVDKQGRAYATGKRSAPRHLQGADLFRAGFARHPEKGRLSHPRLAHGRAQEVRPRQGAQVIPVLETLIASLKLAATAASLKLRKGR